MVSSARATTATRAMAGKNCTVPLAAMSEGNGVDGTESPATRNAFSKNPVAKKKGM